MKNQNYIQDQAQGSNGMQMKLIEGNLRCCEALGLQPNGSMAQQPRQNWGNGHCVKLSCKFSNVYSRLTAGHGAPACASTMQPAAAACRLACLCDFQLCANCLLGSCVHQNMASSMRSTSL